MASGGIGEVIPTAKPSTIYKNVGWFEDIRLMETDTFGHDLTGKEIRIGLATAPGEPPVIVLSSAGLTPLIVFRDQTVDANKGWFDIVAPESNFASIPPGEYVYDVIVIAGVVREGWLKGDITLEHGVTPSP